MRKKRVGNALNFNKYELDKNILRALKLLNYEKPTLVQEKVIKHVLGHDDLVVKSKTGSGKTAAFGIPICQKIDIESREGQVLILVPTRELAIQIKEEIGLIGRFKKIRCAAIFGRQSIEMQKNELKQRVHVIVATPGRLIDHIKRGNVKLDNIETLILDEADEMLELGFADDVSHILEKISNRKQTMFFSATMPDFILNLAKRYMESPKYIEIEDKIQDSKPDIVQYFYEVENKNRKIVIDRILKEYLPEFGLIFCNTRSGVESLTKYLKRLGYLCEGLHGGMSQGMRIKIFQKFRRGHYRLLIATGVAARGIDFDRITHVINYELPFKHEEYVHRIGRTARMGNKGCAISLVLESEMEFVREIEEQMDYSIIRRELKKDDIADINSSAEVLKSKPSGRKDKAENFNKNIVKIRINAGKDKKIRPGDLVGAIASIDNVDVEDIGIIDVQKTCSYVEILNGKGDYIFSKLEKKEIKGRRISMKKVRIRNF